MINEGYFGDEMTRYGFKSHMERYMRQLLTNPKKAQVDDYLKMHGITNEKALEMLLKRANPNDENSAVLIRKEKIRMGEDGKDVFCVTYKIPRENYNRKMRNLYINCFESNIIEGCPITEDINYYEQVLSSTPSPFKNGEKVVSQCKPGSTGDRWAKYVNDNHNAYVPHMFSNEEQMVKETEAMDTDGKYAKCGGLDKKVNECDCAGCMQGGGDNPDAGQYVKPLGKPVKRTIYMREDQVRHLKKVMDEGADTGSVGDYTYTAPAFSDAETRNHKGIFKDKNLMAGGVFNSKINI